MEQIFPCKKKWVNKLSPNDLELIVEFTGYTTGKVISVNDKSPFYISNIHYLGRINSHWFDIRESNSKYGWEDYEEYLEYDPTQQADSEDDV